MSDLHLGGERPRARADIHWRSTQLDHLRFMEHELDNIQGISPYHFPVMIVGDIWNQWNTSLEDLNALLRPLRRIALKNDTYVVWGQHDLPYHNHLLLEKSAFDTLMQSTRMFNLSGSGHVKIRNEVTQKTEIKIHSFPWTEHQGMNGIDKKDVEGPQPKAVNIAMVHAYCYSGVCDIPGMSPKCDAAYYQKLFKGYDFVVLGDHHKPFKLQGKGDLPTIVNCGGMIGRTKKEAYQEKCFWILYEDKTVDRVPFPADLSIWNREYISSSAEDDETPAIDISKIMVDTKEYLDSMKIAARDIIRLMIKAVQEQPDAVKVFMKQVLGDSDADVR